MQANDIISALRNTAVPFDAAALRQINQAAVDRIRYAERVNAYSYRPGDRVTWTGRAGIAVQGTVIKKNQTTVSVRADTGVEWRVGANLLSRV